MLYSFNHIRNPINEVYLGAAFERRTGLTAFLENSSSDLDRLQELAFIPLWDCGIFFKFLLFFSFPSTGRDHFKGTSRDH